MAGQQDILTSVELFGRWGSLRPLAIGRDSASIYSLSHDSSCELTWRQMKVGPFSSLSAFDDHVKELVSDQYRAFFVVVTPDDQAVGWLCLMDGQEAHKSIELGYVLYTPRLQRTTLATEALYLVMQYAFGLGYGRLEWTCTAENERSRRAADRLGFTFEGVLRKKWTLKGVPRDIAMYSLLKSEWPARGAELEAWLSPSNFADGRQLSALRQASLSATTLS
ncbi:MAG: GNAT family N-acetyltransferase [Ancylobacter novellus]|uniref:GNAT family N-acetyltransferase n=1 Tax=Ancylobacter novellus TaxID=921 RepID=A0A2W5R996_ANCNO|nr:MAG: GNAT family N-acetyltransferase [Ancylobacter novellus]